MVRALHEVRFADEPLDPIVWMAPFVIELHVDAIYEPDRRTRLKNEGRASSTHLERWLQWEGRHEHATVCRRIASDEAVRKMVSENPDIMRSILRPSVFNDAILEEFKNAAREGPDNL